MEFTPEQLTKAKAAKSAEELIALAKENGMELSEEEAKKFFAELNKEGALADDELDDVSGGCGYDPHTDPHILTQMICYAPGCDYSTKWQGKWEKYEKFKCPKCGCPDSLAGWVHYSN